MTQQKWVDQFEYKDLGFSVILRNAPMIYLQGEWLLNVNLNELQRLVVETLVRKRAPLTGAQLAFVRKYFECTRLQLGQIAGTGPDEIEKWEARGQKPAEIGIASETCIRLFAVERLHADSEAFKSLYKMIVLRHAEHLAPAAEPLSIDVKEELPLAS